MSALAALRERAHEVRMLGRRTLFFFVLLWTALITWLSSQASHKDDPTSAAAHLLFNSGHAPLFGFWAAGVAFLLAARTPRPIPGIGAAALAVGATIAFGVLDEFHQSYVPGRTSSWTDVVTDALGAAITLLCLRHLASPRASAGSFALTLLVGALAMIGAGVLATTVDSLP